MTQALQVNLGFVGGGQMARGIIGGLLARGMPRRASSSASRTRKPLLRSRATSACEPRPTTPRCCATRTCSCSRSSRRAWPRSRAPLRHELDARPRLVISIAAGIRAADLQRWCGPRAAVVRAMPNRPSLVGAGATGLYAGDDVSAAQRAVAGELLGAVGLAEWVADEAQLDLVTALSGSGPA